MYKPSFRLTKTRVPILSKDKIDEIAENYISDFCPEAITEPMAIDIDSFAVYYLGLKQDFQYLSHNGVYLGMTVFNNTDKVPVYNPETNTAEYIHADARTVIIDNSLLKESQEHRYRFTMGHESGHDIFHTAFFTQNPNQMTLFQSQSMMQCGAIALDDKTKPRKSCDDKNWMEWQANYMSSALLMPKSMVLKLVNSSIDLPSISQVFNVSTEAARYRLKGLGIPTI